MRVDRLESMLKNIIATQTINQRAIADLLQIEDEPEEEICIVPSDAEGIKVTYFSNLNMEMN